MIALHEQPLCIACKLSVNQKNTYKIVRRRSCSGTVWVCEWVCVCVWV